MPNIASSAETQEESVPRMHCPPSYRSSNDIHKKSKKHSSLKFLKSEFRLSKSAPNNRYKKKSFDESSTSVRGTCLNESGNVDWNQSPQKSPQNDFANTSACSDDVMAFHIPEPNAADKYQESGVEDEVAMTSIMRYSRAFQHNSSTNMSSVNSDIMVVEDLDEGQSPFALQEKPASRRITSKSKPTRIVKHSTAGPV